jgi:hypothetical protein
VAELVGHRNRQEAAAWPSGSASVARSAAAPRRWPPLTVSIRVGSEQ